MHYDIIGDIHGCNQTLVALLEKLGYHLSNDGYSHPDRKAIFLGDFIDRGPGQREVIEIVRPMIVSGAAYSVMGNHEYNAICYHTKYPNADKTLREHTPDNEKQHKAFLDAYENYSNEKEKVINWFKTLPLWLDLGKLKIIHACWDINLINKLQKTYGIENKINDKLLYDSAVKKSETYEAIETLLKGKEVKLPNDRKFPDNYGKLRNAIRIRWWDKTATTYKQAHLGPESARTNIPEDPFNTDHILEYSHDAAPVFHGHYWLEGNPKPLAPNIVCVDYSVGKKEFRGKLVAYCWNGEKALEKDKFVWVDRLEEF